MQCVVDVVVRESEKTVHHDQLFHSVVLQLVTWMFVETLFLYNAQLVSCLLFFLLCSPKFLPEKHDIRALI